MIPDLPHPNLEVVWHGQDHPHFDEVSARYVSDRARFLAKYPSRWFVPKMMRLDDGSSVVDYAGKFGSDDLHSFAVAKIEDHPFLDELPSNAPRAVKHMYRKEVRVRYLGVFDYMDWITDVNRAEAARKEYNDNLMELSDNAA